MALLRKRGALTPFVASAEVMKVDDAAQAQALYLKRQNWQERVWLYYDQIPEVHYAAQYIANAVGKIRLVAAKVNDLDADQQPTEVKDGPVADAVKKLKSQKGGQSTFLKNIALNLFGPGEAMLLATHKRGGTYDWEALSIDELRVIPGTLAQRYRFPGAVPQDIARENLIIRMWRSHPRFTAVADSALAACIDQCEQLLLLTKAEKAMARSRFAGSGLLFIPLELVPPAWQNQNRYQDPAQSNPLIQQITEAMMEPLRDESHPSSVVPVMLFGPAEYGEKIKYFTFERAIDKQLKSMRDDSIKRLAAGIDMPSEIVDGGGLGRTNHWSSLQIKESVFVDHVQPFIEAICDSLTTGYLVPALVKAGMKQEEAEQYCVWYDPFLLITKADRSESSLQLHDRLVISNAALREDHGYSEADAPDDDEYAKRVGLKLMQPGMAVTGEPPPVVAPGAPGGAGGVPGAGPGRPNVRAGQAPLTPGGPGSSPPKLAPERRVTGPASQGPRPGVDKHPQLKPTGSERHLIASGYTETDLGIQLGRLDQALMRKLRAHGAIVLEKALEGSGKRLRGRLPVSARQTLVDVPDVALVAAAGPAAVREVGLDIGDLVPDEFAESERQVLKWLTSGQEEALAYLRGWLASRAQAEGFGIEMFMPTLEENAKGSARLWRDNLLAFARNKVFSALTKVEGHGESDEVGFPPNLARETLVRAGGGPIAPAEAPMAGGVGTGKTMQDILVANGIPVSGYQWIYGADRRSFQGHLQLDGAQFAQFTDPVLEVWPEDSWLRRRYYAPGDHNGCQCQVCPLV